MQERLPENRLPTGEAEPMLYLGLLGAFTLRIQGQEVRKLSRSVKWLLALFVLKRSGPISREWLAERLWPDTPPERSSFYLRRSLTELRSALGPECRRLTAPTRATLYFDFTAAFCDVITFDRLVDSKDEPLLETAVSLYQGAFLEECGDGWLLPEQTHRRERYLTALETLSESREQLGDLSGATEFLQRAVKADPLRETAQRKLMRLRGKAGDTIGVERQYRELWNALRDAFQIEPTQETVALYQELRARSTGFPPSPKPSTIPAVLRPFHNLPHSFTSLIGRQQEREQVRAALRNHRMVTLVGPSGVGKTRLALFVAEAETGNDSLGICFADMTAAGTEADVPQTLAVALQLPLSADTPPSESLRRFLQPRSFLLILDNAEHLADACASLAHDLLRTCADLTILCTSRQPLYVAGEMVLPVAPLAVRDESLAHAEESTSAAELLNCESVRLLLDRVCSAAPAFRLESVDIPVIASICRSLDGLPLALELIAVRFRSLSPREIAARLDLRFRLLSSGSPGQPRHRSLHAALDWSYELLSEGEKTLLRHLSAFRGGWTLEAAEAICPIPGAETGTVLTALVEKSLVVYETWDGQDRYRLLEMTRQYAAELLDEKERSVLQQRHAAFFYRMAQAAEETAQVKHFPNKTVELVRERDNFRVAHSWLQQQNTDEALWLEFFLYVTTLWTPEKVIDWIARQQNQPVPPNLLELRVADCVGTWALWQHHPATESLMLQLLEAARLCGEPNFQIRALNYLNILETERGNARKGWEYMEQLMQVIPADIDAYSLSRVTAKAAICLGRLGEVELAVKRLEAQIQREKQRGEWVALCATLFDAGEFVFEQGDYDRAQAYCNDAVLLAEQWHRELSPYLWQKLGHAAMEQKDFARARECLNQGLIVSRRDGKPDREGWALWDLAEVAFQEGCREEAEVYLRDCILLFQALHEPHSVVRCLVKLAKFCVAWEQYSRAALLLGSAERAQEEYDFRANPKHQLAREQLTTIVREFLETEVYEENWQWGRKMTLAQAVDFVLKAPK